MISLSLSFFFLSVAICDQYCCMYASERMYAPELTELTELAAQSALPACRWRQTAPIRWFIQSVTTS